MENAMKRESYPRPHEKLEVFCPICFARFESDNLPGAVKKEQEHVQKDHGGTA
jgi:hypothetical protein